MQNVLCCMGKIKKILFILCWRFCVDMLYVLGVAFQLYRDVVVVVVAVVAAAESRLTVTTSCMIFSARSTK